MSLDKLLNPVEAAEFLGVAVSTLSNWRVTKTGHLPFVKVGRLVRYRPADLQEWLQLNAHSSAGSAVANEN